MEPLINMTSIQQGIGIVKGGFAPHPCRTWGAERIRGELLKLGLRVSKSTIQKYIYVVRKPGLPKQT